MAAIAHLPSSSPRFPSPKASISSPISWGTPQPPMGQTGTLCLAAALLGPCLWKRPSLAVHLRRTDTSFPKDWRFISSDYPKPMAAPAGHPSASRVRRWSPRQSLRHKPRFMRSEDLPQGLGCEERGLEMRPAMENVRELLGWCLGGF